MTEIDLQEEQSDLVAASSHYLPALDGLRALSISLVFFSHIGLYKLIPGGLGVLVFFVISGFLLTRQMVGEVEATGSFSIGRFYVRRFLRLAPTLLAFILTFSAILIPLGVVITGTQIFSAVFYFANYYAIFRGYPTNNPFPILWSLAVEEHFYIFFPFIIYACRRHLRRLLPWLCGTVTAVLAWRYYLASSCTSPAASALCGSPDSERIFHGTDTIFDCILYGSILALLAHYHGAWLQRIMSNRKAFFAALLILGLTLGYRDPFFRDTLRLSLQALAIGVMLFNVLFNPQMERARDFLSSRPMLLLGRMSYALYLAHFGVFVLGNVLLHINYPNESMAGLAFYAAGTAAFGGLAYAGIERPMVKWRRRFGSRRASR